MAPSSTYQGSNSTASVYTKVLKQQKKMRSSSQNGTTNHDDVTSQEVGMSNEMKMFNKMSHKSSGRSHSKTNLGNSSTTF